MPVQAIAILSTGVRYVDVAEADELAAALPELAAYRAASGEAKAAALDQATLDVDAAMPYQGRKLDPDQPREFPRAFGDRGRGLPDPPFVWDWDPAARVAVVRDAVRRATLYQADAILAGHREARLSAQHDGVVYELTGALAESYKATPGAGVWTGLCRRAWVLVRKYRLQGGRLE
jgi:hypothetical protein